VSNVVKFRGGRGRPMGADAAEEGSLGDLTGSLSDMVRQLERILEAQVRILSVVNACPAGRAGEALVSEVKASIEVIKYELEKSKSS
jgi:hypothetical protein